MIIKHKFYFPIFNLNQYYIHSTHGCFSLGTTCLVKKQNKQKITPLSKTTAHYFTLIKYKYSLFLRQSSPLPL